MSEQAWRDATPHVVAALVRLYGDFAGAEDATPEALLAAACSGRAMAYRRTRAPGCCA